MNAKHIAIFDFDPGGCHALAETVRAAFSTSGEMAEVEEFTSIPLMAQAIGNEEYDMAFVVVVGMMALEAARLVRERLPDCLLFLVSGSGEYALEGYRIQAQDYLVKPVSVRRVAEIACRGPREKRLAGTTGVYYRRCSGSGG